VVHKWLGPLVRGAHERDEHALDLFEVSLECIKEAARLQVLRSCAHGKPIIFDDVANAISIRGDRPEAEQAQCRVAAVRR
jgi:hypothetical protein